MSKGLFGVVMIVMILMIVGMTPSRIAHAWNWETVVYEGTVTRTDGTPVANVMVEATDCLNRPASFTNASGHYRIEGISHACFQEPMTISTHIEYSPNLAAKDKNTLTNAAATTTSSPSHINMANIQMPLKTIPVPEYNWLSGALAVGGATGAIIYIHRGRRETVESKTI